MKLPNCPQCKTTELEACNDPVLLDESVGVCVKCKKMYRLQIRVASYLGDVKYV